MIAEDSAALLGVAAAALGVWSSHAFDRPELDGVASIVIGLLLCGVATLLIVQARNLLVGAAVNPETAQEIRRIATEPGRVRRAAWPLTMYLGPEDVLLAMDIEFDPDLPAEEVQHEVNRIEQAIRERYPRVKRIYIEARRVREAPAAQSIEASARQAYAASPPPVSAPRRPA